MSCASYLGTGHRIEFFGEDGTLVLHNPGADYMRGFDCSTASGRRRRSNASPVSDPVDAQYPDGRIAPVSRLAKRFFDAIESGGTAAPGFRRRLSRAAADRRRPAVARQGVWIDVARGDGQRGERA